MPVGRIKVWLKDKGFGFIVTEGNSPDIFVHITEVRFRPVLPGDVVKFDLSFDGQGRPRASNVIKAEPGIALSVWENIPEVKARKARELYGEALIARSEERYEDARNLFEEAISLDPQKNFFEAYASMERFLKNWDRVDRIYNRAREYFPDDIGILDALAMAKRKAGNLHECANLLREAVQQYPNRASLHLHLADTLVDLAEYVSNRSEISELLIEARFHFNEAIRNNPKLTIRERNSYNKMWILHQKRSHLIWQFVIKIGFEIIKYRVLFASDRAPSPSFAWILVNPANYKNSEMYSFDKSLLIIIPYSSQVTESHVESAEELHKQLTNEEISVKQDLFFFVTDSNRLENYLKILLENPETHPTVIPLEESLVENVLEDNETLQTYFDQLLSRWIFKRDLYKGNLPVSGRRFFGREREIGLLNQSIKEGHSVGIFGLRKSGKTSLLLQLKFIRKDDIVTYIDPQSSSVENAAWICWRAVKDWETYPLLKKCKFTLSRYRQEKDLINLNKEVLIYFKDDLHLLLSTLPPEKKCVIMIDEVDLVVPTKGKPWDGALDLFRVLRGVIQESQGKLVVFICAANPAICEQPQWEGVDNPVFQFFEEMFLPLLSHSECKEMVTTLGKGMGVSYEEDALDLIYELSGGHPFLTRRLCSILVNRIKERPLMVERSMVEKFEDEFIQEAEIVFLKEIGDRLLRDYPSEWEILEALASGFSVEEVKEIFPNWSVALRHLEGYQLINSVGGEIKFKIKLLEKWLKLGGNKKH